VLQLKLAYFRREEEQACLNQKGKCNSRKTFAAVAIGCAVQ